MSQIIPPSALRMKPTECRTRYGRRRQLVCRLPHGHRGPHAIRRRLRDLLYPERTAW